MALVRLNKAMSKNSQPDTSVGVVSFPFYSSAFSYFSASFWGMGTCKSHCYGGLKEDQKNLQAHGEKKSTVKLSDKERLPEKKKQREREMVVERIARSNENQFHQPSIYFQI